MIRAAGRGAVHVDADVSSAADCDRLVAAAVERTGSLDVIVNNAVLAGDHSKPLLETEPEDWDAMMAVNLRGPYLLCRAAVRQMLTQPLVGDARGPDRQHHLAARDGRLPGPLRLQRGEGRARADDPPDRRRLRARRASCATPSRPGKIVTGTAGDLSASEEGLAYVRSRTPFARLGRSEDVAAAVAYLAGEASYTSGINLMVDGGWMAY